MPESESESNGSAQKGDHTFEFTSNLAMMRFIRMFLTLQVVGIMIDNTYVELPVLFRTLCRNVLFYVIRFYSRPFIDVIYLGDYYWGQISEGVSSISKRAHGLGVSQGPVNGTSTHRLLSYTSRYDDCVCLSVCLSVCLYVCLSVCF